MFGRRRRPVLGAAVLVGASRAAARHEVQKQVVMDSQREIQVEREVEARRMQEEEQERRTQRAVEEAMKKAATDNQAYQQSAAPTVLQSPQQFYNNQPPIPMQDTGFLMTTPGQPYTLVMDAGPSNQPNQPMRAPSPQVPIHFSTGPALGSNARYCTQCGFACQVGDRFCCQCGAKQVDQGQRAE
ncbi:hypothetical protein B0J13DRAFT_516338 [Dactylonectria estremocensis]|uniref:Uncharacterized protein n=1 Tax=Dactylonectria estremocensis TaxID=1079267 RepID=A0A9P9I8T7_9HYPO|nr:hypothetical protein B0J13DRAFT_516338 [Dactylonectria estremocensis]